MAHDTDAALPRKGRPPTRTEAESYRLVLAAATREFLEQGFAASTSAIASTAGVSKRTVYAMFPTKADMLVAVFAERSRRLALALQDWDRRLTPSEALEAALLRLAEAVLSDETVALYRLIAAQASTFPDAAAAFYREGPGQSATVVAELLSRLRDEGAIKLVDPITAASMLISMVVGEPLRAAALGGASITRGVDLQHRVRMAVSLFLNGCASKREHHAAKSTAKAVTTDR